MKALRLPKEFDLAEADAKKAWRDYFGKHKPKPADVQKFILRLHNGRQHDHVIAAIESALINGQAQPWMYEVLALSMRIRKRPKAEIERVLLSMPDFSGTDASSLLYSAAYLTRFDRHKQALQLYKQAAMAAPHRAEPFVLGMRLAVKIKDHEAIGWAAPGVLTNAWTKEHAKLHREAEDALLNAIQALKKDGKTKEAEELTKLSAEARKRDLVVKVEWAGVGDLDLLVEEPSGTVCSFKNPQTTGGGVLAHEGRGFQQNDAFEKYVCSMGMPGTYRLRIRYSWGKIVGMRAKVTIIRYQGTEKESKRVMTVPLDREDKIVRISLKQGRRKIARRVPQNEMSYYEGPQGSPYLRLSPAARRAASRLARARGQAAKGLGFRPVISLINEGATLSAQAVVSGDRRYVRLTLRPDFRTLTDVFTFSFINSGGNPTGNPGPGGFPGGGGGPGGGFGGPFPGGGAGGPGVFPRP